MWEVGWVWWWHGAGRNIYFLSHSLFTPQALNKEPLKATSQFWHLPFSAGVDLCYTIVVCSEECCLSSTRSHFFLSILFLLHLFFLSLIFFVSFIAGFLKPQCSLAPPMQRGRSGEACSCFSGMCPLHQRRLSSGNTDCVNNPIATRVRVGTWVKCRGMHLWSAREEMQLVLLCIVIKVVSGYIQECIISCRLATAFFFFFFQKN